MKSTRVPTVLSAYSGLGGLDLGLEAANFSVLACIEQDHTARQSLLANRPSWTMVTERDIAEASQRLQPASLGIAPGDLGILAGGPPCQPFSKAAQWSKSGMAGLNDERANSLSAFLRLVEVFLPRVVLIENVRGFATGKNTALPVVQNELDRINARYGTSYSVECRILNAVDFGVPQRRERAILIAMRTGDAFNWPMPTHEGTPVRAFDAIGDLCIEEAPKAQGKWAALLPSIPEGQNYLWHTPNGGGAALFGYRTRFWSFLLKLAKAEPSWTLPAHPGPSTGPFHWLNRPLAIEEMLRLQSFPIDWQVEGDYRAQVRQVGNATPPLLAEVIGRAIGSQVFGMTYAGPPALSIPRKDVVPPPEPLADVASEYLVLEGDHPPHPGPGLGPSPRVPAASAVASL